MGTIADKLTHLAGTKTALREAINRAGGNLTADDTFRSYAEGWLRDQEATLTLDFTKQQYVAKNLTTKFPDRVGFSNIVTFTRASTGTYFDSNGVLQVAAVNQPRFDHDTVTGAPLGILIEEQRTNLLTYSNDFTNPAWNKERGSWTNSPDTRFGTVGTLTEDLTTGTRITGRAISLTSGTLYTHTERLKAVGRSMVRLQIFQGPTVAADFDLLAGTVSGISGGTASIKPVGDGWYDCSVTLSVTTTQSYIARFYPIVGGSASYLGDGREAIRHAGAQLEAGSFPTSYIPTEASQVTRAADAASVNTLSPWYNPAEGKFEVSARGIVGQPLLTAGSAVITADSAAYKDYSLPYTTDPAASSLVIGKGYTRSIKYFPRSDV